MKHELAGISFFSLPQQMFINHMNLIYLFSTKRASVAMTPRVMSGARQENYLGKANITRSNEYQRDCLRGNWILWFFISSTLLIIFRTINFVLLRSYRLFFFFVTFHDLQGNSFRRFFTSILDNLVNWVISILRWRSFSWS